MNHDLNSLKHEDLKAFAGWAREQRDYFSGLLQRVEAILSSSGVQGSGLSEREEKGESETEEVVHDLLKKSGRWMANSEIRGEFQRLTGTAIDRLSLRHILKGGEDRLFKRVGEARLTKWKAV